VVTCVETGCSEEDDATLTFNPLPTVNVADKTVCEGQSTTLTAVASGCETYSYQWYAGSSSATGTIIPTATGSTYTPAQAGDYTCRVTCVETDCSDEDDGTLAIKPCAELEISKEVRCPGGKIIGTWSFWYYINITNTGTVAAVDLVVTDELPPGIAAYAVEASAGGEFDEETNTVTWETASLGPGHSLELWIKARTNASVIGMWLTNTACVDATGMAEPACAVDVSRVYAPPELPPPTPTRTPTPTATPAATLAVAKLVDLDEASAGDELHYTLVVMNDMLVGPDPGVDVQLEDVLPDIVELVPGSLSPPASYDGDTHTIRWTGQVPRGGSVQIDFRVLLTPAAADWRSVTNTVLVTDAFGRVLEAPAHTQLWPPTTTPTPTEVTPVIEEYCLFLPVILRND
jgi:uncharacterized repeat protein (TIGR01451 family)